MIVNIKDPAHPFIEARWDCDAGWGDVDISADARVAVLTNAHGEGCLDGPTQDAVIDISDKKHPRLLAQIDDADMPYVHTSTLDNSGRTLFLNPQAAAFYPQGTSPHIAVYDISDPRTPMRRGFISKDGIGLAHDTYVDHRPDGRTLMYAASIHTSDVFDITNLAAPTLEQQTASPEITISHDVQPNHDRSMIIVDDEGAAGGQLDESVSACGRVGGPGPAAVDSGSIHFYAAAADGTFAGGGAAELGSWNAPANANTGACVAHVFWQAPAGNRLTQASYRTGAFVLDFEDPTDVKMLGSFVADGGSDYWSFKPHRGYIFATDQLGGLDILRYTGEGGARWPTTSGPAEVQRSARQGVPCVPLTLDDGTPVATKPLPVVAARARSIGRFRFTARLRRLPGAKGARAKVTFTFVDARRRRVGKASVRKPARRATRVKVVGGAVAGAYRWTAKVGRRTVGHGAFTVKPTAGETLSPSATLSARAR